MGFTTTTITHTFTNADTTAASGTVKFWLTGTMTNGTTTIVPAAVTSSLNSSGVLSQALTSNVDTATWVLTGGATAGAFTVGLTGSPEGVLTTAALNWNATAAQVQAAILAVPTVSGITCTGGPLNSGTISIAGVPGGWTLATTSVSLTGGTVTIANTVTGTTPPAPWNTKWRCDIEILGADPQSYLITVPTGGGSVDLGTLLPNQPQV